MTTMQGIVRHTPWAVHDAASSLASLSNIEWPDVNAVAAALSARSDEEREFEVVDGVAVITIHGAMMWHERWWTRWLRIPTYEAITRQFRAALEDSAVKGILFDLDTPGGEAAGINELAELVYQSRGTKPVVTYAAGLAASAGYWLASATDEIWADDLAMLGSIGTISRYIDAKGWMEQLGLREIVIVSEQSPHKDTDPAEPDGEARIRATLTEMAAVFIRAVARNRGISEETVVNDFGRGWIRLGQDAVDAGLADQLGSLQGAINAVAERSQSKPALAGSGFISNRGARMATDSNAPEITAEYLTEHHADLVAEFVAQGRAEGVTAESQRIAAIEALALPGHDELLAQAKGDTSVTADIFAARLIKAEQASGGSALRTIQSDEESMEKPAAAAAPEGDQAARPNALGAANPARVNRILTAGRRVREKSN